MIRCRTLSALAELTATGAGASHGAARVAVHERRFSAKDGLILFYREYGHPASGPIPLLCLPGLPRNSKDFEALALGYASDRRVVYPDYRNYTPRTHVSYLLDLLTVAALGEVVVIGTSPGGLMAMALAVVRPACLRGVVLNDIGPDVVAWGRERIANYVGTAETPRDWATATTYCRDAWGPARPDGTDADWDRIAHPTFVANDGEVLRLDHDVRVRHALKESGGAAADAWRWFGALTHVPALAIRGENSDVLSRATFECMAEVKPDLMRLTVPRREHAPDLSEPECLEAIDDFLRQL